MVKSNACSFRLHRASLPSMVGNHFEGHPIYVGTEFGYAEDSGITFQLGYAVIPLCFVQFG